MTARSPDRVPVDGAMKPRGAFSIARLSLCALPLFVLVLWVLALSGLATAGGTATASSPARVFVAIPASAGDSRIVMLDLAIKVVREPASGQLGAVVRLKRSDSSAVELGRVSIGGDGHSYQFDVSRALREPHATGSAEIEVSLIDRGGGPAPAGAALSIVRAQFVTR